MQLVQTAGVAAESIKFGTCSLQSDKYICVCQGGELVIVDMTAGNAVKRWPISAEAAIMNPTQKIVALRGERDRNSSSISFLFFHHLKSAITCSTSAW